MPYTDAELMVYRDAIEQLKLQWFNRLTVHHGGDRRAAIRELTQHVVDQAEALERRFSRSYLRNYVAWHVLVGSTPDYHQTREKDLVGADAIEPFLQRMAHASSGP